MGGPRNHKESRLQHPPKPGGPTWDLKLVTIRRIRPELDKYGYTQLEADDTYEVLYRTDKFGSYTHNREAECIKAAAIPGQECAFWFAQNGCHSTIMMGEKTYALMGVIRKANKTVILKLKEVIFAPEVKQWVEDCVGIAIGA